MFHTANWIIKGLTVLIFMVVIYAGYAIFNVRRHVKKGDKEKQDSKLN